MDIWIDIDDSGPLEPFEVTCVFERKRCCVCSVVNWVSMSLSTLQGHFGSRLNILCIARNLEKSICGKQEDTWKDIDGSEPLESLGFSRFGVLCPFQI